MKIEALMVEDVCTCRAMDSLARAAQMMWERDCGCAPVVDEELRVIGMLTDRDICMAAYTQGRTLHDMTVASAMSHRVHGCRREDDIAVALEQMKAEQVRRLPVLDSDHRLLGVISLNDLAVEAAREQPQKRRQLTLEDVGRALAVISAHRQRDGERLVELRPSREFATTAS